MFIISPRGLQIIDRIICLAPQDAQVSFQDEVFPNMCSPKEHVTIARGILTLTKYMIAPLKSLSDVISGEVCAFVGYMMDYLGNSSMHSLGSLYLQVKA
jgi:hypothetical protein